MERTGRSDITTKKAGIQKKGFSYNNSQTLNIFKLIPPGIKPKSVYAVYYCYSFLALTLAANSLEGLNAGIKHSGTTTTVFFEILRAVFIARFFT